MAMTQEKVDTLTARQTARKTRLGKETDASRAKKKADFANRKKVS